MISKKLLPFLLLPIFAACGGSKEKTEQSAFMYPKTRKVDTIDTYFNTQIADPYRWLEDDRSKETAEWVKEENAVTYEYLSKIPFRDKIKSRLTKIWNFEKRGVPFKKGKNYFFYKNDGIQNQSVLYVQEGLDGPPKILLDPNTLAADGTASLGDLTISKNGKYVAYSINRAGSDWSEIFVMDIETGKNLSDDIKWVKFSNIAWKGDGFYYSAYDAPKEGTSEFSNKNEFHKVYYHLLGESQDKDKLIFEDKAYPLRNYTASTTDDETLLLIYINESTSGTALSVKDLTKANSEFITLVNDFENNYNVIDNEGTNLYVLTDKGAPKYQLVKMDYTKKTPYESWEKIIPETADLLESVSLCKDKFIVDYLKDVTTRLFIYNRKGTQEREIKLPGLCKVNSLTSYKNDHLVFFSYSTFTAPSIIYKYDILSDDKNKLDIWFQPTVDFKSDDYETKQVFYASKDGTKIPMF
ncbi:MAG TPA: S9 family peptidase, partial [Bacteroidia bacterium]|nr:S9 family peptidase [Bacteroidia bacterium]